MNESEPAPEKNKLSRKQKILAAIGGVGLAACVAILPAYKIVSDESIKDLSKMMVFEHNYPFVLDVINGRTDEEALNLEAHAIYEHYTDLRVSWLDSSQTSLDLGLLMTTAAGVMGLGGIPLLYSFEGDSRRALASQQAAEVTA